MNDRKILLSHVNEALDVHFCVEIADEFKTDVSLSHEHFSED